LQVLTPETSSWLRDPLAEKQLTAQPALLAPEAINREEALGGPIHLAGELHFGEPGSEWQATPTRDEQAGILLPRTVAVEDADSERSHVELLRNEELPDWYRADLPRICRTCRDYRPSAEGQRGWCANSWAFTHRRLVLEDDPAPCQSAIGDWWLPVDDVWLVAADVSSHGRATPLLDRLTGKADRQRRRS
jgi:hypothetical protein